MSAPAYPRHLAPAGADPFAPASAPRAGGAPVRRAALVVGAVLLIALAVARVGAPPVLAGLVVLLGAAVMLLRPEVATVVVLFLFYLNVPGIASQVHHVPPWISSSFVFLLAAPLLHYLLVGRQRPRLDRTFRLMLLFLAVFVVSAVLVAKDMGVAARRIGGFGFEGLALYWLVLNVVRSRAMLRRVMWTLLAAAALLASLSVYQGVTHDYSQHFGGLAQKNARFEDEWDAPATAAVAESSQYHAVNRAEGPLGDGNPNRYAQILVVLLPLALFRFRAERSPLLRLGALGAGGIILCGILLTYSRGTFLTLVLLLPALVAVRWVRPGKVLAGVLMVAILIPLLAPAYYDRIRSIGEAEDLTSDEAAQEVDGSIRGRTTEMLAALHVFLDHPVLGVGPGQYAPFYSEEYHAMTGLHLRELDKSRRAHSLYFEMAAETGALGLGVFLLIDLSLLVELWRMRRWLVGRDPEAADLVTAFWLGILAYLGTAMFLHLSYERYYWLLLALAGAAVQVIRDEYGAGRSRQVAPSHPRAWRAGWLPSR